MSDSDLILWRENGTPVSARFDDPYYSVEDGWAETRHVFLAGNDLLARLTPGFHVAELGFGTGLNLMALAAEAPCPIRFTSFEAFPLARDDMARAAARFPGLAPQAEALLAAYRPEGGRFQLGPVSVELIIGDARATLPRWDGLADAWFLDGFAPARNPELWSKALMAEVGRHTAPAGTFATYTSAGAVRRALTAAGFTVTKRPGYGRKREMSTGRRGPGRQDPAEGHTPD
ncbi:tRNA (5-methylaminomethyl-2-thiouridine)(34)-methyltransferase MnmD [Pontivivens ytuae]|uniref:tRNA (5-methylaminomethyl-2-thiouridine)(34)-methyltransferase MnmD n=1 Tax=Pontivivens ytuae TaxID=2789856 RepID=A0A7S9LRB1_9RHOB|nr:tRNA (5-methylaminomethyl-2-thiouridine)(34)-methyltransferase MnmD [Pontivivens ytuae]QPH53859.1 tRNA (5-methylaminomethyl-2-thiouridine)(34)-methyltransferase MnmD [Pontivivens ytuae]